MPANPTIREQYTEYAKGACEWCKKGYPNYASTMGRKFHYFDDRDKECTAMTFEAWAEWRIERLTEALREIDELGGCDCIGEVCGVCIARKALAAQPESGVTK